MMPGNLTTGSNNIDIANKGVSAEASTIRIGTAGTQTNTYIAGISGEPFRRRSSYRGRQRSPWHDPSSARFKEAIKPMDKASEAILALQPVTFHYKQSSTPRASRSLAWWPKKWKRLIPIW